MSFSSRRRRLLVSATSVLSDRSECLPLLDAEGDEASDRESSVLSPALAGWS